MAERELATTSMNMKVNVSDLCMCACVLQVRDRHVQELQTEILAKDGQLQEKDGLFRQLQNEKDRSIRQKDRQIQQIQNEKEDELVIKDEQIQHLQNSMQTFEIQMEVELGPGLCFHEHHAISHLYM